MEVFLSKRGKQFYFQLLGILALMVYFLIDFGLFQIILTTILLFAVYGLFYTRYYIKDGYLVSSVFFYRFKVKITDINKITKGRFLWDASWKISTSSYGLMITHHKYDELLISPEEEEKLIQCLIEINPEIKILEKR
jgi:hypothetical protein